MSPRRRDGTTDSLELALAEQRELAIDVAEQRDRLAAALAASTEGVIVVDAEGAEVFRNPAAEPYRNARHSDAVVDAAINELLDGALGGEALERELQLFGPPRSYFNLRAVPLPGGGAAAFVADVSEIHRTDSVRRDFVANVSHELKTPIGALELLADTLAAETDPAVAQPLAERMVKEAERLGRIVDDLLDLSIIEAQDAPVRDPERLDAMVDEAVDRLRPAAIVAAIDLRVHHGAADALVACDRRQVVSAIANLLDNAVKYSEAGSAVDVETCFVEASEAGDAVQVVVRDHGIGVPRGDLERIFERFYRVDQARSRDTGGTGLGLAIVRNVARAHGGDVSVDSVEGQGSTFVIELPRDVAEASAS